MNQAERAKDVPATVLTAQSSSVSAVHLPPLFTRDFTLLCLVTLGYFFSFFFFFPTLPFYIKHLGGREADVGCFSTAASAYLADVAPPAQRGEATSYWGLVSSLATGVVPPFALGLMSSTALHRAAEPA